MAEIKYNESVKELKSSLSLKMNPQLIISPHVKRFQLILHRIKRNLYKKSSSGQSCRKRKQVHNQDQLLSDLDESFTYEERFQRALLTTRCSEKEREFWRVLAEIMDCQPMESKLVNLVNLSNLITTYGLLQVNAISGINQILDFNAENNAVIVGALQLSKMKHAYSSNLHHATASSSCAIIETSVFSKITSLMGPYEEIDNETTSYPNFDCHV